MENYKTRRSAYLCRAPSRSRAFCIAGAARIVLPISDISMNRTRGALPAARANAMCHSRTSGVAIAHSGTPTYRSIQRIASMFTGKHPHWSAGMERRFITTPDTQG
jgi:hypothetical protein